MSICSSKATNSAATMSTPWIPLVSKNNSEQRIMALDSSWIRRLCPNSHDNFIPINLKSRLPRSFMPNNPLPPPPPPRTTKEEIVEPSNLAMSFGPFQARPNVGPLRPSAHDYEDELVDVSDDPSQFPRHCTAKLVGRRIGSSSRDGVGDFSSASRNFHNPHAFNLNSARRHLHERKNYSCPREPEEPFSYWNMGTLEKRANFVSSVRPSSSLIMPPTRKRTTNTYGFISSKFRRFHNEED
ncbi:uncharacterized protein A4U43_C07F35760 [Asparagus officinalis]|uniref:Uncharacterized protein n=1 Tax=Asparagus officinalis TaxID=4686 RepID=A0A5P1EHA3_ASPOF|nr:uncharacterized protein LOC109851100 [Asparagus officinalis]ONK65305.1 uncharacterized protein A4U43_C07F35760 [Asparagus officinalis]